MIKFNSSPKPTIGVEIELQLVDENNSDYQDLLKIITLDELHEQTHNINKAESLNIKSKDIDVFVETYSREKIMNRMAKHILAII